LLPLCESQGASGLASDILIVFLFFRDVRYIRAVSDLNLVTMPAVVSQGWKERMYEGG